MVATFWRFAKELLFFCGIGALSGAGICLIMFLHLGTPQTPQGAGYVAVLFVKSGVQLGFIFSMVRASVRPLRRWISTFRGKCPEQTQVPHTKIDSGEVGSNRTQRRFAALAKRLG